MRDELSALYQLLTTLCKRANLDVEASKTLIARTCTGLDETITSLETRVNSLSDSLDAALDRLRDLNGKKSY